MARIEWEYWEADLVPGGFWAPMCPEAVRALEDASAGGRSKAKLSFTNERTGGDTLYEFDLDKMEQLNTDTKYRRTIRRTPALPRRSASACAGSPPARTPPAPPRAATVPHGGRREECSVCAACTVTPAMKARRVSRRCTHATRSICDDCMEDYVSSAVRGANVIACVDCSVRLDSDEALHWARQSGDTEAVNFLDQRLLAEQLKGLPDFAWCAHGCGMGQEHPEREKAPMDCRKCRGKTCFRHKSVWHEGQTCDEWDAAQQQAEREAVLRTGVKACPQCGEGIQKKEGCARMTCTCKHTFCWDCFAPYDGPTGIRSLGNDAHASACPWHSDNLPSFSPEE
jgi:hypothetical protein